MKRTRIVIATLATLSLAGCAAVGPDHKAPEMKVATNFEHADARGIKAGGVVDAQWWRLFRDATLTELVHQAVAANHDLRVASARVRQARALRGIARADQYPTIDGLGTYQRARLSENTPLSPPILDRGPEDLFQIGLDANWELDLFGRVRRSVEAAEAEYDAAVERRRDVVVSMTAEVARTYFELRGDQRQTDITRRNSAIQADLLSLTTALAKSGLATDVDVARARAQLETTRSALPALAARVDAAIHRLSVLTGQQPLALAETLREAAELPHIPSNVAAGVPSELLRRRPDIRAAERELAAATAQIGIATAGLFPRITLTGAVALLSGGLGTLLSSGSVLSSLGPQAMLPILNGGRIRSRIEAGNASQQAALARYEQTVLHALEEAETALSEFGKRHSVRDQLADSLAANEEAVGLARVRYEHGLESFLTILDAQRELLRAESALVQSEVAVRVDLVAVFKALGGGWAVPEQTAATVTTNGVPTKPRILM